MTYEDAKAIKAELEQQVTDLSRKLSSYPRGKNGLTPDDIKFTADYKSDKLAFNRKNEQFKSFNKYFVKQFATEYRKERSAIRAG